MKKNKEALLLILWAFFVFLASILPPSSLPKVGWSAWIGLDKLAHIVCYLILSFFSCYWMYSKSKPNYLFLSALFSAVYGAIMEVLQFLIYTGRNFELLDIIANIIGSIAGVAIFSFIQKTSLWKD